MSAAEQLFAYVAQDPARAFSQVQAVGTRALGLGAADTRSVATYGGFPGWTWIAVATCAGLGAGLWLGARYPALGGRRLRSWRTSRRTEIKIMAYFQADGTGSGRQGYVDTSQPFYGLGAYFKADGSGSGPQGYRDTSQPFYGLGALGCGPGGCPSHRP